MRWVAVVAGTVSIRIIGVSLLLALCFGSVSYGQSFEWLEQLGTTAPDYANGVSADGLGSVYFSGYTGGDLGEPQAGIGDAIVGKYDASGELEWVRQLGTNQFDFSGGVSADGLGNVYISGATYGSMDGVSAGDADAFLSKYDDSGALQWARQIGTSAQDGSRDVSADGLGNVYIAGTTRGNLDGTNAGLYDAFLTKYDDAGSLQWTRQLGTSGYDYGNGVSTDELGNVYISGDTDGGAFVSKYEADGTFAWSQQPDLGDGIRSESTGVSADELGNVYITGWTDVGAFLSKYDIGGNFQWTQQLGSNKDDIATEVSADGLGNVYISGATRDGLDGAIVGGYRDAFIAKYDSSGALRWVDQFGTHDNDFSSSVSADGLGNVYISGSTDAKLGEVHFLGDDAFVAKYSEASGDGNDDGKVDGLDYLIWAGNFGDNPADDPPGAPENGDYNNDGKVDGSDYLVWAGDLVWAGNFGQGPNDGVAVPEPTTGALFIASVIALMFNRRKRVV